MAMVTSAESILGFFISSSALSMVSLIRSIHTFNVATTRSKRVIENTLCLFESSSVEIWLLDILIFLE